MNTGFRRSTLAALGAALLLGACFLGEATAEDASTPVSHSDGSSSGGADSGASLGIDGGLSDGSLGIDGGLGDASAGVDAGPGERSDASTASPDAGADAGVAQYLPCPTDGNACEILPYGDSITQGFPFAAQGGYRAPLLRLALADKKKITFIGRLFDGLDQVDNVAFPKNHEGHFAMPIEWLTDNNNVPNDVIQPAHIILLHAGTNNRSDQAADAAKKLELLIDKIIAAAPNALLLVSTIIPCGDNGQEDAFVRAFDQLIPAIVQKRAEAGKHIQLVDQYTSFVPATMFTPPEKYHPNLVGYAHMADVWYASMKSVLSQ